MERVMGIEPTSQAWEARILPMNYTRIGSLHYSTGSWKMQAEMFDGIRRVTVWTPAPGEWV